MSKWFRTIAFTCLISNGFEYAIYRINHQEEHQKQLMNTQANMRDVLSNYQPFWYKQFCIILTIHSFNTIYMRHALRASYLIRAIFLILKPRLSDRWRFMSPEGEDQKGGCKTEEWKRREGEQRLEAYWVRKEVCSAQNNVSNGCYYYYCMHRYLYCM